MEQQAKTGKRPKALDSQPVLFEHLEQTWVAYQLAADSRIYGAFGQPQPIPISESLIVARLFGLDPVEFVQNVQAMDQCWLEHYARSQGRN